MRSQLVMISPFHGESDLTRLARGDHAPGSVDPVSLADVLRNGFVYSPHSIYDNIRVVSCGFALLSYVDVGVEIRDCGGDGMIDGLGSDT